MPRYPTQIISGKERSGSASHSMRAEVMWSVVIQFDGAEIRMRHQAPQE